MVPHRTKLLAAAGCALALIVATPGAALAKPDALATTAVTTLAKGPYLQALGPTAVTIKAELALPARAHVDVFAPGEDKAVVAVDADESRTFHALRVEGLRPDTLYEYVVTAGTAASPRGRFITAPAASRPFHFLAYGDNRSDAAAHAAVVAAMAKVPADFLVNTGDMVMAGPKASDWVEFFAIEGELLRDRCLFASVGNHELYLGSHDGEVAFLRYFGGVDDGRVADKLYGSFRWSNTRFFVLNAMDGWTGAEREWLRAELDRARDEAGLEHRIAVLHHGPFSAGRHGGNEALHKAGVVELLRAGKVDLVLAGHDHDYERGEGSGLKYIVTGGGGAPLYKRTSKIPETRVFESAHHFVEIAIDGARVSITARRPTGGEIESCGFTGGGPWECDAARPPTQPAAGTATAPGSGPAAPGATGGAKASGCGCSVPSPAGAGGVLPLALAAALALARRRR